MHIVGSLFILSSTEIIAVLGCGGMCEECFISVAILMNSGEIVGQKYSKNFSHIQLFQFHLEPVFMWKAGMFFFNTYRLFHKKNGGEVQSSSHFMAVHIQCKRQ